MRKRAGNPVSSGLPGAQKLYFEGDMMPIHEELHNAQFLSSRSADSQQEQLSAMSEAEIIDRAKQKDAAAFESLYKTYSKRVFSLCFRMLRNAGDAEDATQEAFLQVFRKIPTFRGESAFSTWLHRLAVNLVLMRLRRKSLLETPLESPREFVETGKEIYTEAGGPDLSLLGAIERLSLESAIDQLPACYKLVFELHDVRGYKHREIAQMMDCSVGTTKAHLHRARKHLRQLLGEKLALGLAPMEGNIGKTRLWSAAVP